MVMKLRNQRRPTALLDRTAALPLFAQVRAQILNEILSWPDTSRRIGTEEEIAERFGVSRVTVRKALEKLIAGGLLKSIRGRGLFVTDRRFEETLSPSLDVAGAHFAAGRDVTAGLLSFETTLPNSNEIASLSIEPSTAVLRFSRLRSVSNVPFAIDERVIQAAVAGQVGFTAEAAVGDIVGRLRDALDVVRSDWTIAIGFATSIEADLLSVAAGAPLLERRLQYDDNTDRPVMIGRTRHRADLSPLQVSMPLTPAKARTRGKSAC